MQLKQLSTLGLAGFAAGQSLTEAIGQNSDLSQLATLLGQYPDLAQSLAGQGNITILAPSNAAIGALLAKPDVAAAAAANPELISSLLKYHVLTDVYPSSSINETPAFPQTLLTDSMYTNVTGGQVVKVETADGGVVITSGLLQESKVVTADITFTGGIIHIIDAVLTIPASDSATATAANLTSFVAALGLANLVSTVESLKDVTLVVPGNDAFAQFQSMASSVTPEQIAGVLSNHVVQGTVGYSSSLTDGLQLTTLANGQITITIKDGDIFINSAKVVIADVLVANGIVHVIDNLLLPGNGTGRPGSPGSGSTGSGSAGGSNSSIPSTNPITAGAFMQSAAMGAVALFGGAAVLANW